MAVLLIVVLLVLALLIVPTIVYFLWHWLIPVFFVGLPEQWQHPAFWHVVGLYYLAAIILGLVKATVNVKKD